MTILVKKRMYLVYPIILFWHMCWSQNSGNLDILNKQLVNPILAGIDSTLVTAKEVIISSVMKDEINQWLVSRIRDELLKNDIPVFEDIEEISDSSSTIVIQNTFIKIFYKPVAKNLLLRNSKYERNIESLLSFYIKEADESIIYSYSKTQQMTDTLLASQLDQVENRFHLFTQGETLESGWMKKFFEPAIITVTTIGVVFLFYSLRSG